MGKHLYRIHTADCCVCYIRTVLSFFLQDVLILRQFLTTDGDLLPRKITGLCYNQHKGIRKSIEQAKRAGKIVTGWDMFYKVLDIT